MVVDDNVKEEDIQAHSILLVQFSRNEDSRTYLDFHNMDPLLDAFLRIFETYLSVEELIGVSVIASNAEVLERNGNLSISQWVKTEDVQQILSIADSTTEFKKVVDEVKAAEQHLRKVLSKYGILE